MAKLEKVVIVGGGVGGLTSALALKKAGVEVEVHEKYPQLAGRATGFTLWSYAIKHLMDLGLEDPTRIGSPIEFTEIRNQVGKLIDEFPVGKVSKELGAPSCDVNRRDLQQVAIELLGDGVVRMGSECVAVEQDEASATAVLKDGSRATGDLLIGADGIHSVVRGDVSDTPKLEYSGYSGWGGVLDGFRHELLKPHRHVEVWARGSKGGVADIGNDQVRWYVMHREPTGEHSTAKEPLLEHVDGWYEVLGAAVEAAPEDSIVASEAWDLEPMATWIDRRVVVIGDAAHATTPFASMGACMTIEDSVNLAEHLTGGDSLSDGIAAFEADRKKRGEDVVQKSRHMAKLQMLHSPIAAWLRDEAFSHTPPEKMEEIAKEMASGK
jgi:2-polyprenyl-6-methoxyphenol hydroxylase-like FAD-dependent oxidoreductase